MTSHHYPADNVTYITQFYKQDLGDEVGFQP